MNLFSSTKFIGYHIQVILNDNKKVEKFILSGKVSDRTKIFICETRTRDACQYLINALTQFEPIELHSGTRNPLPEKLKLGCSNCSALIVWYEKLLAGKKRLIVSLGLKIQEAYKQFSVKEY